VEDAMDDLALRQLVILENSRYFFRPLRYRNRESIEFNYEEAMSETSRSFNNEEFLRTFRVHREQARNLALLLRETHQFEENGTTERPVLFQLLVFCTGLGKRERLDLIRKLINFSKLVRVPCVGTFEMLRRAYVN